MNDLNSARPNVKSTAEIVFNHEIEFLDVQSSHREDGSIRQLVHRKGTWSGQYIHFQSFVPLNVKRILIGCIITRAIGYAQMTLLR